MITNTQIKNKLYAEFIKPINHVKNFIGVEIEIPIINLDKKAVDFNVVHKVTEKFNNYLLTLKKMELTMMEMYFPSKTQKQMILYVMTAHTILLNLQWEKKKTSSQ